MGAFKSFLYSLKKFLINIIILFKNDNNQIIDSGIENPAIIGSETTNDDKDDGRNEKKRKRKKNDKSPSEHYFYYDMLK